MDKQALVSNRGTRQRLVVVKNGHATDDLHLYVFDCCVSIILIETAKKTPHTFKTKAKDTIKHTQKLKNPKKTQEIICF